jgi:hypothetical protein
MSFNLLEWLYSRAKTTNVVEDAVKKEPLYTVGRNTTIMESRREIP